MGVNAKDELVQICHQIFTSGEWPVDFMQSVVVPLTKKTNAPAYSNHRTVSLIAHASKIFLKIPTQRLESKVEAINFVKDEQFGFRKGRGTRDAIGVLRLLGERSL